MPAEAPLYEVIPVEAGSGWDEPAKRSEALRRGDADVVLLVPPGLAAGIAEGASSVRPELFYDSGDERSRDSFRAVRELLDQWNQLIVKKRLERDQKPDSYLEPVAPQSQDVSQARGTADNVWSRMFPFLLVMMSLTGAFYPAVDLCAGEKERGTMETLLITPASRPEIVTGKFLTVWAASIATALVNLISMGITAWQLAGQTQPQGSSAVPNALSMPGFDSLAWMLLVLLPLSAFFSALCVALAAMARSMKEGQYYLTPLYLVAIPLVFATLAPGITLNLFTSLIPVTGASLLLRSLIKGDYFEARTYFLPVLLPLLVYAALALRWAVDQFRSEAVLFRESERFDLSGWMRHVIRDRGPFPSSGEAFFAFALMLATTWFGMRSIAPTWFGLIQSQLFFIALPVLILTFLLTSSPASTLLLRWPKASHLALAFGLAISLNPVLLELRRVVEGLFPIPEILERQLAQFASTIPDLPTAIFVLALVPAVCEELAFRGFILQGLRTGFRKSSAVVLSALPFWLPPRPDQLLPAALQRHSPGPPARPLRPPKRQPAPRHPLPLHEQRPGRPHRYQGRRSRRAPHLALSRPQQGPLS